MLVIVKQIDRRSLHNCKCSMCALLCMRSLALQVDNDARSETEESDAGDQDSVVQNGVANGKHKTQ